MSPGGFETPKSEISVMETELEAKPAYTAEPTTYVDAKEEEDAKPLDSRAVYTISNVKSGAAIDVSGGNRKNIIGWPFHGAENQQVVCPQSGEIITNISCATIDIVATG